ncbi:hypothetical protein Pyn_35286 [Prunus yedoensis var. nudiflora]|uniref:Uncharacterized protein n=1 Tax=Prunus yedoensis var. nudiflora TaxID=2094558 RepID=A0A314Z8Z2_PRUYE|nr:hypothetical protein Pyn_35286 [Prunus yedoensis var. nudiflora]
MAANFMAKLLIAAAVLLPSVVLCSFSTTLYPGESFSNKPQSGTESTQSLRPSPEWKDVAAVL